jgi:hypothetical protein
MEWSVKTAQETRTWVKRTPIGSPADLHTPPSSLSTGRGMENIAEVLLSGILSLSSQGVRCRTSRLQARMVARLQSLRVQAPLSPLRLNVQ